MNLQLVNVLVLGAAFHLIFFSFQTSVFIQQTVVNSIKTNPQYNFTGNGYISLCITYTVFAISNWLAPSIIALTGLKYGMLLGAITYGLYSASFIYPTTWLFYSAAALIGFGAGPLWSAQGSYLTKNSDTNTSSRNAAIFWSMLQSSLLFGNLFVYFAFTNQTVISDRTRFIVYGVLTLVCAFGTILILALRDNSDTFAINDHHYRRQGSSSSSSSPQLIAPTTALGQFVSALKLAASFNMLLLSVGFLFTGQLLSFFTGVFGTSIGATSQFGVNAKKFIGLAGIFIGIGEIFGGSIFGLLGARVSKKLGRDTIFVLGFLATITGLSLTYINLPPDSPLVDHALMKPIIEPRLWIVLLSSVLIGLGDACFNTQIYALLMSVYNDNSVAAFALFKFMQSMGSAIAFLYSTKLNLYYQLWILAVFSTFATICFCLVEWRFRSKASGIEKSESQQNIIRIGIDNTYGTTNNSSCQPAALGSSQQTTITTCRKGDSLIRIN